MSVVPKYAMTCEEIKKKKQKKAVIMMMLIPWTLSFLKHSQEWRHFLASWSLCQEVISYLRSCNLISVVLVMQPLLWHFMHMYFNTETGPPAEFFAKKKQSKPTDGGERETVTTLNLMQLSLLLSHDALISITLLYVGCS